jgi:hypothetical protein
MDLFNAVEAGCGASSGCSSARLPDSKRVTSPKSCWKIGALVAYSRAAPRRGRQNLRGETKMAKKIKKLNKSTKVEAGKTLRKLGIG